MEWTYFPQWYADNVVVKDLEFPRLSDLEMKRKRSQVNEDKKQGIELVSGSKRLKRTYGDEQISNYFEGVATTQGDHESLGPKCDEDRNASPPGPRESAICNDPASKDNVTTEVIPKKEFKKRVVVPRETPSGTITVSNAVQNGVSEARLDHGNPPAYSEIIISNAGRCVKADTKPSLPDDTANREHQTGQCRFDQVNIPGNVAPLSNSSNSAPIEFLPAEEVPQREFSQGDSEPPDLDILLQRCNEILRKNPAVPCSPSVPAIETIRTVSKHDYQGRPRERSFHPGSEAFYLVEDVPHEGQTRRYTTDATIFSKGEWGAAMGGTAGHSIQQNGKAAEESYHGDFRLGPETYFPTDVNRYGNANGKKDFIT